MRTFIRKTPLQGDHLEIDEATPEAIELTRGEAVNNGVSINSELADGLPLVQADRAHLQQMILDLIINAAETIGSSLQTAPSSKQPLATAELIRTQSIWSGFRTYRIRRSGQDSTRASCQQEGSQIACCLPAQPIRVAMLPCRHGGALGGWQLRSPRSEPPITAMMTNYSQSPDLESGELKIRPGRNGLQLQGE
jgi:hypothetical protein